MTKDTPTAPEMPSFHDQMRDIQRGRPFSDKVDEAFYCAGHDNARDAAAEIAAEADRVIERLREALRRQLSHSQKLVDFMAAKDCPCRDYDAECPIQMGEWFSRGDVAQIEADRAALGEGSGNG